MDEDSLRTLDVCVRLLSICVRQKKKECTVTTEHSGLWLFEAGMAYWYGLDFKKEDAGNSDALCSLGECIEKGEGCDQNLPKAMELYA